MRCLVTGATGFIGGAVSRHLEAAGHELVAYVREGSDWRALQDVERVVGDLGDPNRLALAAAGCDAMVHAAGIADPAADPDSLGWVHIAGTENAINAARKAGCRRLIHISVLMLRSTTGPVRFGTRTWHRLGPTATSPLRKLRAEELVRVSGRRGFRTTVLRPALVWGPGDTTHLPRWQAEANERGIRIVGRGKKLMLTTYIANLAHAVRCSLETKITTGNVYYVVDTELSVSRDFFTELGAALGWIAHRGAQARIARPRSPRAPGSRPASDPAIRRGQTSGSR